MAIVNVTTFTMKNADLIIEESDFAAAVSSVALTPSSSSITFRGLKPQSVHSDVAPATWVCDLTYAQDWKSATSLSRYLYNNEGKTVSARFKPQSEEEPEFQVNLIITPGAVGGSEGATATATVSLGVAGRPVLVTSSTPPVDPEDA